MTIAVTACALAFVVVVAALVARDVALRVLADRAATRVEASAIAKLNARLTAHNQSTDEMIIESEKRLDVRLKAAEEYIEVARAREGLKR